MCETEREKKEREALHLCVRYVFVVRDYDVLTEVYKSGKVPFYFTPYSLGRRIQRMVIIISVEIIRR